MKINRYPGSDARFPEVRRVDSLIKEFADQLSENPLLKGVFHTGLEFTAATQKDIAHGLGRAYQGWIVVSTREEGSVVGVQENTSADKGSFLSLESDTTATLDIWVF